MPARGALVVGQSGGPTAVINRTLAGVVEAARAAGDAVGEIVGLRHGIEGLLAEEYVDLRRQGPTFLADLQETPSSILGSCRYRLRDEDLDRALGALRRLDARAFVYIGGNDSADTTNRLARAARDAGYELACIGAPKTIDNDLAETDHCPGFGSAARFLALAAMEASRDTEAMRRTDPVKILEVAGRHAGWLAAAGVLGRRAEDEGPHLVYVPERPVPADRILDDVAAAYEAFGHVVIVVSENQPDPSGVVLGSSGQPRYVDAFGHAYFDSPTEYLVREIRDRLGLRARWEKYGTLQRMSIACRSRTDADEALAIGHEATRLALAGQTGVMVVLRRESDEPYRWGLSTAPLTAVANAQRRLPPEFIPDARGGATPAFRRYALPLLGDPLPRHARLT
ncbi:MAG: diphosphate--fructose-6-phosphate 1-phosphotransferase [Chloroflexota bacterium]|nr:diphosphate--fructose-6-phosphate 1-phosphotransferase [Chloroflexota bacterium]